MFGTLDIIALVIGAIGIIGTLYFRFKPAEPENSDTTPSKKTGRSLYWICQGLVAVSILLIAISLLT